MKKYLFILLLSTLLVGTSFAGGPIDSGPVNTGGAAPTIEVDPVVGAINGIVQADGAGNISAFPVYTPAQVRTYINVEDGATADQTGAEIKVLYEGEADTNAFTDADHNKLDGITAGADVTGANPPQAHAASHTDGTDDIQDATAAQKGLATSIQITKLDSMNSMGTLLSTIKDYESLYVEEGLDDAINPPEAASVITSINKVVIRNFAGTTANEGLFFFWKPKGDLEGGTSVRFRFLGFVTNVTAPAAGETIIFTLSGATGALGTAQGATQTSTYTAPAGAAQYDSVVSTWSAAITIANFSNARSVLLNLIRSQTTDTYGQDFGLAVFEVEFSRTLAN